MTTWNSRPASLSRDRRNISCDVRTIYCCTPTFKRLWPSSELTPIEIKILVTDSCLHSSSTGLKALCSSISSINGNVRLDSDEAADAADDSDLPAAAMLQASTFGSARGRSRSSAQVRHSRPSCSLPVARAHRRYRLQP